MITVFSRIGYTMGGPPDGWDVLWSHQYPFQSLPKETWKNLKPHQRVNHFPGTGCFTSKPRLATLEYPFIPLAFQLPRQAGEFKEEVCLFFTLSVSVSLLLSLTLFFTLSVSVSLLLSLTLFFTLSVSVSLLLSLTHSHWIFKHNSMCLFQKLQETMHLKPTFG